MNWMNSIESDDAFGTILVRVNFPVLNPRWLDWILGSMDELDRKR